MKIDIKILAILLIVTGVIGYVALKFPLIGPRVILPADNPTSAAGICAEPPESEIVAVSVNFDIPSPRCQKVRADQKLAVENTTESGLTLWFGKNADVRFTAMPRGRVVTEREFGEYLEPGVHVLFGEPYSGPEIWLLGEN